MAFSKFTENDSDRLVVYYSVLMDNDGSPLSSTNPTFVSQGVPTLKKKMENTGSGQPLYIGMAVPGSSVSESVWQIRKLEYDDGINMPPTGEVFADGVSTFTKVWNDRATYSYS
jgi:hypothetical protein